jgi:hypothetical protein
MRSLLVNSFEFDFSISKFVTFSILVEMMWIELSFEKNNSIHVELNFYEFLRIELWVDVNFLLMSIRTQIKKRSNFYNNFFCRALSLFTFRYRFAIILRQNF